MNNLDSSLETRQLRVFLSLIETESLTQTADNFGVGQSAISHSLNKLRTAWGDQLFVRSGRSIKATPHALSIAQQIREALSLLEGLRVSPSFNPSSAQGDIIIGANEYQRDMVLPRLFQKLQVLAPTLRIRIVSIPFDPLDLVRNKTVDLVLTPRPPHKADIHSLPLNNDRQALFYDAQSRTPPQLESDFINADYIVPDVIFDQATGCIHKAFSPVKGRDIVPKVVVNTFAGIPQFLRGSNMLAPVPGKLAFMSGFASCFAPGTYHALSIHLCWHQRNNHSPLHQWLIELIKEIASDSD